MKTVNVRHSSDISCPACGALMRVFENKIIDFSSAPDGIRHEWLFTCTCCHQVRYKVQADNIYEAADIVRARMVKNNETN